MCIIIIIIVMIIVDSNITLLNLQLLTVSYFRFVSEHCQVEPKPQIVAFVHIKLIGTTAICVS